MGQNLLNVVSAYVH